MAEVAWLLVKLPILLPLVMLVELVRVTMPFKTRLSGCAPHFMPVNICSSYGS